MPPLTDVVVDFRVDNGVAVGSPLLPVEPPLVVGLVVAVVFVVGVVVVVVVLPDEPSPVVFTSVLESHTPVAANVFIFSIQAS